MPTTSDFPAGYASGFFSAVGIMAIAIVILMIIRRTGGIYILIDLRRIVLIQAGAQFFLSFKKRVYYSNTLKANMKSYIPLESAAIFFLANLFLKQGIG